MFFDHGVLGINARNLLYIKPYNKKEGFRLADDKLKTKQYLSARNISVPKLYAKILNQEELNNFNWDKLPSSFVIKPNSGYGGEGIVVIKEKSGENWITVSGEKLTQEDLFGHVQDILDGRYSITYTSDTAFFEQRLISHESLEKISPHGLPDIRIIVYNLTPVMAMLRIPSDESHGKANLHLGGIGIGIDLAKGEFTHAVQYNKIIKELPGFGLIKGFRLPFWDDILLLASQIQQLCTLGYLAVDVVIDRSGPVLIEINARAGLAVQLANLAPLRRRLKKLEGVKITSPEKGVRLAKDLFGSRSERDILALSDKKVIGLKEEIILNFKHGTKKIIAKIDPQSDKNFLAEDLWEDTRLSFQEQEKSKATATNHTGSESLLVDFSLRETRKKGVFYPAHLPVEKYQAVLGKSVLQNFLVSPESEEKAKPLPQTKNKTKIKKASPKNEFYQFLDHTLCGVDKQISILSVLKPSNLEEEKDKFFASSDYNPTFKYPLPKIDPAEIKKELQSLQIGRSTWGQIFAKKKEELINKLDLIESVGNDKEFTEKSLQLYGKPTETLVLEAQKLLEKKVAPIKKSITASQAKKSFEKILRKNNLNNWRVVLKKQLTSRCTIGKGNTLLLKERARFSEKEIKKLIAHEIETHIFTAENGKQQKYQIFARGLANYLSTQEGLAIYNQNQVYKEGNRNFLLGTILVNKALQSSFREVFNLALRYVKEKEEAWSLALKVKRGTTNTSKPGGFTKNHIYLAGLRKIEEFIKKGGDLTDLYIGKINLEELLLIKKLKKISPPKYLPPHLKPKEE